jgi:hypothetical protein
VSDRRKRRTAIGGQFAARLIEMIESPAYPVARHAPPSWLLGKPCRWSSLIQMDQHADARPNGAQVR